MYGLKKTATGYTKELGEMTLVITRRGPRWYSPALMRAGVVVAKLEAHEASISHLSFAVDWAERRIAKLNANPR